jgi:hypothetical protein
MEESIGGTGGRRSEDEEWTIVESSGEATRERRGTANGSDRGVKAGIEEVRSISYSLWWNFYQELWENEKQKRRESLRRVKRRERLKDFLYNVYNASIEYNSIFTVSCKQ